MGRFLVVAAVVTIVLAWPSSARAVDARSVAREFARVTFEARRQLLTVREAPGDPGAAVRAAARACEADWAARPDERAEELFRFYDTAMSAPLWPEERPSMERWVTALHQVRGAGALPSLRDARRRLKGDLVYIDKLFSEPIDACAEVRAWRASGWTAARPPQLARLHALRLERERHVDGRRVDLYRGGRFVQRLGGRLGREVYQDIWFGIGRPDNLDHCDPALIAIEPEEAFCG